MNLILKNGTVITTEKRNGAKVVQKERNTK